MTGVKRQQAHACKHLQPLPEQRCNTNRNKHAMDYWVKGFCFQTLSAGRTQQVTIDPDEGVQQSTVELSWVTTWLRLRALNVTVLVLKSKELDSNAEQETPKFKKRKLQISLDSSSMENSLHMYMMWRFIFKEIRFAPYLLRSCTVPDLPTVLVLGAHLQFLLIHSFTHRLPAASQELPAAYGGWRISPAAPEDVLLEQLKKLTCLLPSGRVQQQKWRFRGYNKSSTQLKRSLVQSWSSLTPPTLATQFLNCCSQTERSRDLHQQELFCWSSFSS